jgi:hypothetical protein
MRQNMSLTRCLVSAMSSLVNLSHIMATDGDKGICAGSHTHEAAFQPLAELLLHPETLKHLGSDSDPGEGAESGHLQRPSSVQAQAEAQQSAGGSCMLLHRSQKHLSCELPALTSWPATFGTCDTRASCLCYYAYVVRMSGNQRCFCARR